MSDFLKMRLVRGIEQATVEKPVGAFTIGNFDGVHIGHQVLLKTLVEQASLVSGLSVLMTFTPHPATLLRPQEPKERLFDHDDQITMFAKFNIDLMILQKFTRELASLSAEVFFNDYIWRPFQPLFVVVGYDFYFGHNRSGTNQLLGEWLTNRGSQLIVVEPSQMGGQVVSSSRVRSCLEEGRLQDAALLLGRNYYLAGSVERGEGRGSLIGVPTVNIQPTVENTILPNGVYACWVHVDGVCWAAAANIGTNPTFVDNGEGRARKVEAHILGFNGNLYGQSIRIEFVAFLRSELKFSGVEELVRQIHLDIKEVAKVLNVSLG